MKNKFKYLILLFAALNSHYAHSQTCACNPSMLPCTGTDFSDDYNSAAPWTYFTGGSSTGTMSVTGGMMNYVNVTGNGCNRRTRTIPNFQNISNNFRAECFARVTLGGPTPTNAPAHYIMAFTQTNADPISSNCTPPWSNNSNSGIFVLLSSTTNPNGNNCCTNPCLPGNQWQFALRYKNAGILAPAIAAINFPCNGTLNFWIRLIVYNGNACLYVFSDPTFTTQIPGSPVNLPGIPNTVTTGLTTLQHGVVTYGNQARRLNMNVDNMRICKYTGGCNIRLAGNNGDSENSAREFNTRMKNFNILPNPNNGEFRIESIDNMEPLRKVVLRDLSGKEVYNAEFTSNNQSYLIQLPDRRKGLFIIEIYTELNKFVEKVSIE